VAHGLLDGAAVPNFESIGDVSRTLRDFLTAELAALAPPNPPPIALLHDLLAPPPTAPPSLSLFLYDILEDGSARNRAPIRTPQQIAGTQRVRIAKPPLTLALRYMFTAWAADRLTEHRMIGRVLQAFLDHPVLSGSQLVGSLANTNEALKLTLSPIALEDRAQVWEAIKLPYRLSINYEVRVVHIDPELADDVPGVVEAIAQPGEVA
jgi:hypothetical protein